MSKKFLVSAFASLAILAPSLALAASKTNLSDIIGILISYLNQFLVLLMGFAVVVFVICIVRYYILPNSDRTNAGHYVMFSLIGFFVILSFWGLVNVLQNTFGLKNEDNRPQTWYSFNNLFPGGGNNTPNSSSYFNNGVPNNTPNSSSYTNYND